MRFVNCGTFAIALMLSCGTSYVPVRTADPVLLEGQDIAEVRAAIIRAMKLRKFTPKHEEGGKIIARLERGSEMIEVAIEYSSSQFLIRYRTSEGLETIREGDEVLIDDQYEAWKKKLAAVIEKELKRPAQERDEAERNRREYELMLARAKSGAPDPHAPAAAGKPSGPNVGEIINQVGSMLPAVEVGGSVKHSEQSLICCINGRKYECPGQAAFDQCVTNGPSACTPAGGC